MSGCGFELDYLFLVQQFCHSIIYSIMVSSLVFHFFFGVYNFNYCYCREPEIFTSFVSTILFLLCFYYRFRLTVLNSFVFLSQLCFNVFIIIFMLVFILQKTLNIKLCSNYSNYEDIFDILHIFPHFPHTNFLIAYGIYIWKI